MMEEDIQEQSPDQKSEPQQEIEKPQETVNQAPKKKIIIYLAVVFVLVLIALLAYFLINNFLFKEKPQSPITTLPSAILTIEEPQDQAAINSSKVTVKGRTNPESLVAAYTDTQEEIFESDGNGNFSGTLVLDEGPNEITFTAFGQDNQEKSEIRSVVFVKEEEL